MIRLHLTRERSALAPRREPYWGAPLGRGRVLGYRKLDANSGSWVARMRDDSNRKVYQKLGLETILLTNAARRLLTAKAPPEIGALAMRAVRCQRASLRRERPMPSRPRPSNERVAAVSYTHLTLPTN